MEERKSETADAVITPNFFLGCWAEFVVKTEKEVITNPVQVLHLEKGEQHSIP